MFSGIVRRVDDLGRIVIPKEIRRSLKVREGDPLAMYINETGDSLILKRVDTNSNVRSEVSRIFDAYSGDLTGKQIVAFESLLRVLKDNE